MARPKLLGSLLLLYVLLANWLFLVGELLVGFKMHDAAGLFLLGATFLEVLFRLSYVIGGIGLIRSRIWAAKVVFFTASMELAVTVPLLFFTIIRGPNQAYPKLTIFHLVLTFLPGPIGLVFLTVTAYAAWWLHKHPNAWQPSQQLPAQGPQVEQLPEGDLQLPRWLLSFLLTIIGTGLGLPSIIGLTVRNLLIAQGKPVIGWNDGVAWVGLTTLFFGAPFVILAFTARTVLKRALFVEGEYTVGEKFLMCVGAFVALTVAGALSLFYFFQSPENIDILIFVPFVPFLFALAVTAIGVLAGWVGVCLWRRMTRRNA